MTQPYTQHELEIAAVQEMAEAKSPFFNIVGIGSGVILTALLTSADIFKPEHPVANLFGIGLTVVGLGGNIWVRSYRKSIEKSLETDSLSEDKMVVARAKENRTKTRTAAFKPA